jgi:hypothetical protein
MDSWIGNRIVRGLSACVESWSASSHLVYNSGNVCGARIPHLEAEGTASGCYVGQTDQEVLLGDHHAHDMVYLDPGMVVDCSDFLFQISRLGASEDSSNEMANGTANGNETSLDTRDHFELEGRPRAGEETVNEGGANLKVLQ